MTGNSSRAKSLVDDVTAGNQEQARGMGQIAVAVMEMQNLTQHTASSANKVHRQGRNKTAMRRN